jgi:O-antigen ligase
MGTLKTTINHVPIKGVAAIKADQLGASVAIVTVVLMQFIDLAIVNVGEFVLSFQKLCALLLFPLSLLLIGRLRIKGIFIVFAVLMILVNSSSYWIHGDFLDSRTLSANATVFTGLAGAVVLHTGLTIHSHGIPFLVRAWVLIGCFSAILTVMQAVGLVPMSLVPENILYMREVAVAGLMRGTGLKYDPNFQAMILAIGLIFAQFLRPSMRWTTTTILLIGIISTFSRMAFLVSLVAILLTPLIKGLIKGDLGVSRLFKFCGTAMVSTIFVGMFILLGPNAFRYYLGERITNATVAIKTIGSYSHISDIGHPSSAQSRILLAKGAWMTFREYPLLGIGAYKSRDILEEKVGIPNVAHNTYLELLMTGGIFGLGALGAMVTGIVGGLYLRNILSRAKKAPALTWNTAVVTGQVLAFALFALFLSLNNSFILWLPLVLAQSHKQIVQSSRADYI